VGVGWRCGDANLIEIPVQIDEWDKSLYHVAFFTNRDVLLHEELTWDYNYDFNFVDLDLGSFACKCGSSLCRNTASLT